ncbi:MAG: hypothetical protein AAF583_09360 [Pseudomonadota bacterium]
MKRFPVLKTFVLGTVFAVSMSLAFMHTTAPDGFEPLPTIAERGL